MAGPNQCLHRHGGYVSHIDYVTTFCMKLFASTTRSPQYLVRLLPRRILVEVWRSPQMDRMQSTLRLMAAEARTLRPGGEAIITRLADILVTKR